MRPDHNRRSRGLVIGSTILTTLIVVFLLAVVFALACARHPVQTLPDPARCGVERPRYLDDDSGDMGRVSDDCP